MPIIGFTVFRDKLLSGEKRQTIRLARKIKVGDKLYLYWKLRTKDYRVLLPQPDESPPICTESLRLPWAELCKLPHIAERDGFEYPMSFALFFERKYHPAADTLFDVIRW